MLIADCVNILNRKLTSGLPALRGVTNGRG